MNGKYNYLLLTMIAGTFSVFVCSCTTQKQVKATASTEEIAKAISTDRWVFTANNVMPQSGRSRIVNGIYEVYCSSDTVLVYLPYFGRSYSASAAMNGKGPLDFQTTSFSFTKQQNKKGGWDINIKPKDNGEIQSLSFILYDNGFAQLNVLLTNRSPISFSGTVSPKK